MILQRLNEFSNVDDAAEAMAGNWRTWGCFVWFGSDEVPHSDDFMLGYLVNNEATLRQLTNLEFVRAQLARWWGNPVEGALCGDFGSSFWGEKDMLNGLMVRVFDDHDQITEPFRVLFQIAKGYGRQIDNLIIDRETFYQVRRREMTAYVHRYLEYECTKHGDEFSTELVDEVTSDLIENYVDYDHDDLDAEIDELMDWDSED